MLLCNRLNHIKGLYQGSQTSSSVIRPMVLSPSLSRSIWGTAPTDRPRASTTLGARLQDCTAWVDTGAQIPEWLEWAPHAAKSSQGCVVWIVDQLDCTTCDTCSSCSRICAIHSVGLRLAEAGTESSMLEEEGEAICGLDLAHTPASTHLIHTAI